MLGAGALNVTGGALTLSVDANTGRLVRAEAAAASGAGAGGVSNSRWAADLTGTVARLGDDDDAGDGHRAAAVVHRCGPDEAAVCVVRQTTVRAENIVRNVTLLDRYEPVSSSPASASSSSSSSSSSHSVVKWTSTVLSNSSFFRSDAGWQKQLRVRPVLPDDMARGQWWLASTGPVNETVPTFTGLDLRQSGAASAACTYGGSNFWKYQTPRREVCPLPVSVHGATDHGALGLVLSLDDTVLAAEATHVNATSVVWVRRFDRLGGGARSR